jgi:4-aminobutyrate aminotransferase
MQAGVYHAPYGEPGAIERTVFAHLTPPSDVAAIFVEPIQGEGGYLVPPAGWLAELRALCDEHGILLVADEVQSGVGRTGRMWAVEHVDIAPDVLLAGKGLASGLPLAAIVARERIMRWEAGAHGSTFGGNPVACAAALATLDLVEGGLADNARDVGRYLLKALNDLAATQPTIEGVRGRGLMIGIDFADHDTAHAIEQECFRRGLLVLTCGVRSLRLAPPLVVSRAQADTAIEILTDAISTITR